MKNKKGRTLNEYLIILAVLIVIALVVASVLGGFPGMGDEITYELPNKVVCNEFHTYNNIVTICDCDDGKTYINPEFYREIKNE